MLLAVTGLAAGLAVVVAAAPLQPVAHTPFGTVRGLSVNGTRLWRGIPFAAPPVGDLRFRPPQPPKRWGGVLDATEFGASCLQMGSGSSNSSLGNGTAWKTMNLTISSEDCLYANVYAPEGASSLLPVMVYFHAGEFRFGSANDAENSWPYTANESMGMNMSNIVLVSANARLSMFGFAALDALRARDPSGSTGNYGMQDQRAVLRWVKRCIESFGGDPTRITVFGESSGGASVAFHLASEASRGLFSRAILQSPGLTQSKTWYAAESNTQFVVSALTATGSSGCAWPAATRWRRFPGLLVYGSPIASATSLEEAQRLCEARADCFLLSHQRNGTTDLFGGGKPGDGGGDYNLVNLTQERGADPGVEMSLRLADAAHATDCLLGAAAVDLVSLDLNPPYDDTFETDAAAPTEDGVELATPLPTLARTAVPHGVDLLSGSNLDEGTEFMSSAPRIECNATEVEFEAWAVKQFGATLGLKVPPLYQAVEQPAPLCFRSSGHQGNTSQWWQAAMRSAGDSAITCRVRELLRAGQLKGSNAWWYFFAATPIHSVNMPDDLRYWGSFHGAEVPFVFGAGFELNSGGERALSRAMGCYWVNFAATGNPNEGPSGCAAALSLPLWPTPGPDGDAVVFSNTTITIRPRLKKEQCDLYAQYDIGGALDAILI